MNKPGMIVMDAQRRPIPLGPPIGTGGEATVYHVEGRPALAAKIYGEAHGQDRLDKINAMVAMGNDRLLALAAWPTAPLFHRTGTLAGFTMPKLAGHRPVFQVYGPKLRLKQFPTADWRFLVHAAGNVARAFAAMHASGLVVGDVNHGNLFVAEDATVRFIDADSMQVTQGRRRWPCEVGVSTHQPPEMQGLHSYRDVLRTPNHDGFGLAVLVFQLLCMGRHPFSGRFAGPGEPPDIPQAIAASLYAYSADTARTRMTPPPGSLPMAALPASTRALFDAAFAPGAVRGGRPSAEAWATEMATLGRSLRACTANAAHYYPAAATACPWCEVEARSGTVLFPAVFVRGRAGGVAILWQEIEALAEPRPAQDLALPDPSALAPSATARAAAQGLRIRAVLAVAVLTLAGIVLVLTSPDAWPVIPAAVAAALALLRVGRPRAVADTRRQLAQTRADWATLSQRWAAPGPAAPFATRRAGLAALKREADAMPRQRDIELQHLAANRRQQQGRQHLESFEIASARVPGIGKAKVAALLSYGVETAADIDPARIAAIPGFGPALTDRLVAFRIGCENTFRFDGNRAVSPAQVAALDGMLAQRRARIEAELAAGLAQLRTLLAGEARHREQLAALAAQLRPAYAQTLADARALGIDR